MGENEALFDQKSIIGIIFSSLFFVLGIILMLFVNYSSTSVGVSIALGFLGFGLSVLGVIICCYVLGTILDK